MAFFSHTRTHTRTWQMTEWYVWQLWEVSEMLQGYWLMAFSFTHTHTDMKNDRMLYLTIMRNFRDVSRILAHGFLFHTHTRGHDRWQNMSDNCEKFQECYTHTSSWHFSFTQTRTWHDRIYISDSCEKFQRCYTDTGSWHAFSHTHTRTWLKTEWYIWQLWEVSEMLQWYTDTGSWHSSPRHTHTHGHDWCQNNISDNCEKFQRYYTDTGSWHSFTHTHTHTHKAFINGTHNTIMEKLYQWCCSWCIHTTSPDGWNLASTFPYRKNCSMMPVTQCIFQSWELDLSIFLDFLEHRKS